MAKEIAEHQGKGVLLVSEGQEKDDFWDAIGGKQEYSNDKRLQLSDDPHSPRLFQCSNANGLFTIEEIPHFDQSDLIQDDVMLLGNIFVRKFASYCTSIPICYLLIGQTLGTHCSYGSETCPTERRESWLRRRPNSISRQTPAAETSIHPLL